jgi:hypothetical protein
MGDCLHQRAVVRQYLARGFEVFLETSWASMYHDLPITLLRRPVSLTMQRQNAQREDALFSHARPHPDLTIQPRYAGGAVMSCQSQTVLEAMCLATDTDYATADYRLPVPDKWFDGVELPGWRESGKPLLIYRPLVGRHEWKGGALRNADPAGYNAMFAAIRDSYFVISVAALVPNGPDTLVGPQPDADLKFHNGELTFEQLAALFAVADLIFTSSGFPAILGPAVGTAVVNIVGGYENVGAHASGARFVPFLSIGPENKTGCHCFTSACRRICDKRLNLDTDLEYLRGFLSEKGIHFSDSPRSMFTTPPRIGMRA